jgi:hypothetical protein
MPTKQLINIQKRSDRENQEDGCGKVICAGCESVMSRRLLKKPDSETGQSEVTYRCPKCGAIATRWVRSF